MPKPAFAARDRTACATASVTPQKRRGDSTNPKGRRDLLFREIRTRGFFNPHFMPQTLLMLDHDRTKLPLDFIGETAKLSPLLAFVRARLQQARPEEDYQLSPAEWLTLPVQESKAPHANPTKVDTIVPSAEEVREVCRLFRVDYLAFGFAWPTECGADGSGPYAAVPTADGGDRQN
jgi:hypothetical protein